jgi:CheY-like chemotaxis protein
MRSPKTMLIVDDNLVNQEIYREILGDEYLTVMAGDGMEAIRLAIRHRPHVVLLDVMLPGLDGYEICKRLRSLPETRGARIIMASAKAMPSERDLGMAAGADAYITKPFDESDLLAAIQAVQLT